MAWQQQHQQNQQHQHDCHDPLSRRQKTMHIDAMHTKADKPPNKMYKMCTNALPCPPFSLDWFLMVLKMGSSALTRPLFVRIMPMLRIIYGREFGAFRLLEVGNNALHKLRWRFIFPAYHIPHRRHYCT
jgi:hypothetical protein